MSNRPHDKDVGTKSAMFRRSQKGMLIGSEKVIRKHEQNRLAVIMRTNRRLQGRPTDFTRRRFNWYILRVLGFVFSTSYKTINYRRIEHGEGVLEVWRMESSRRAKEVRRQKIEKSRESKNKYSTETKSSGIVILRNCNGLSRISFSFSGR